MDPAGIPLAFHVTQEVLPPAEIWSHRMLTRPSDDTCPTATPAPAHTEAAARAAFLAREGGAAVDAAELLRRIDVAADHRTRLPAAFGLRAAGVPESARLAAVLTGLARYGMLSIDRRRLARPAGEPVAWGLDLVTGALRRVPAGEVFPAPDREPPSRPPVGTAAGLTWLDALESGLAQQVEALLALRLADPATRVPRLDLRACETDERGTRLLGILREAGETVAHDLSGLLSVPACAVRTGPATVLATGATPAAALRTAAERALAARLSDTEAPSGRAPARLPAIAEITADREAPAAAGDVGGGTEAGRGMGGGAIRWARPADALRALGRTPVAVLLDHDPWAVRILPYVVRVVLIDE